jgi:methyltransferase
MVSTAALYLVLIGATYAERFLELLVSGRNARRMLSEGAVELGPGHYRVMVVFHALFPAACALEVVALRRPFPALLGWIAFGAVVTAQALRWWSIRTLAGRWTTRVIVLSDMPPVTGGPYRWIRHPNYLAVIAEIAALPLVHGAWLAALAGSAVNAAILSVRIRAEERALGVAWQAAFAHRPRFLPWVRRA